MSKASLVVMFTVVGGRGVASIEEQLAKRDLFSACISAMVQVAKRQQGRLVKTIGNDKQMWTFPQPDLALTAAEDMAEAVGGIDYDLHVGAGFHFGEVIEEGGDVFGDNVNTAARVADLAKFGEILVLKGTMEQLPADSQLGFRPFDTMRVKGKEDVLEVFEYLADDADATVMTARPVIQKALSATLVLTSKSGRLETKAGQRGVTIGKDRGNDVVVANIDDCVSRFHARIEFMGKQFMLVDQSTNGTYVYPLRGDETFLRRDSLPLDGQGVISLGGTLRSDTLGSILYEVTENE